MVFILILPIFGKGIDYQESLLFYGVPIFFAFQLLINNQQTRPLPKARPQLIALFLYLISVIFSVSIGSSYYTLMNFITVLLIFNIGSIYLPSEDHFKKGIVYAATIYSLITIVYKYYLPGIFLSEFSDNVFVQNWGHSYIADFLVFSIPILIHGIQPKKSHLPLLLITFISLAIISTNSRSSIVALTVGIMFIKSQHPYQHVIKIMLIAGMLISLTYIFLFSHHLKSPHGSRPEYWTQALSGFIRSPIVGIGPGNFNIINRQYRQSITSTTNYAHNSVLESLVGNGALFTIFTFYLIGYGLWHQFHRHRLFFVIGTISLINSFLDPSWSSPGILALTLIIIFWKINSSPKPSPHFITLLTITIFLFLISKVSSDVFYSQSKYEKSLKLDPFNPNSLSKMVASKQSQIRLLYKNDPNFINLLTSIEYLPENEADFYRSFQLDPHGSTNQMVRLIYYYTKVGDYSKLQAIMPQAYSSINPITIPFNLSMEISKSMYKLGLHEWKQQKYDLALTHFQKAVIYSRHWSHFEIELATALWQSGQEEAAWKQLTGCQQNSASAKHCQEFEIEAKAGRWPAPGTFDEVISSLSVPLNDEAPFSTQRQ